MKRLVSTARVRQFSKRNLDAKKLKKNIECLVWLDCLLFLKRLAKSSERKAKETKLKVVSRNHILAIKKVEEDYKQSEIAQKLDTLATITECGCEIKKTKRQVNEFTNVCQSHDLIRARALQAKLELVEALVNDLDASISNQKVLTEKLQIPYQGEQMQIEAKFHSNTVSLFENISQSLSNFQEQVEVIHWHKQHEMNDDGVDNALKDISSRVNGIRLKADRLKADGV